MRRNSWQAARRAAPIVMGLALAVAGCGGTDLTGPAPRTTSEAPQPSVPPATQDEFGEASQPVTSVADGERGGEIAEGN